MYKILPGQATAKHTGTLCISQIMHAYTNVHTSGLEVYLLVLAPCGPLFKRRDVPERQTTREVDDRQQGAIRAKAHAEYTILDNTNAKADIFFK